eukprot:8822925-Lingulodinium_polyedra.AAC.1
MAYTVEWKSLGFMNLLCSSLAGHSSSSASEENAPSVVAKVGSSICAKLIGTLSIEQAMSERAWAG